MTDRILLAHLSRGVHIYAHEDGYTVEWYEEGVDGALFVRSASSVEDDREPRALRESLVCVTEHIGEPGDYRAIADLLFPVEEE
jgi:hypothetical protein